MNLKALKYLGVLLMLAVAATGCQFIAPNSTILKTDIDDAIELMGLLPAIEAAQEVTDPSEDQVTPTGFGVQAFNPNDTTGPTNDDTPFDLYTALGGTGDWERYPATGTLVDGVTDIEIYGVPGNLGFLRIKEYAGGADYQVEFYVYPTLSPSVEYVYEAYYVMNGSWALVDAGGTADPIAYIAYETHYMDGVIQTNVVEWNSAVDGLFFDTFAVPDNPADSAYDFPAVISTPTKGPVLPATYSAHVESSFEDDDAGEVEATEFYTEVTDVDEIHSAVSYVTRNYSKAQLSLTEETVRRYMENIDAETKTVRSRSTTELAIKRWSWTVESTEKIDIAVNGSSLTTYDSVVTHTVEDEATRTTTIALVETGVDTNAYAGTMSITSDDDTKTYVVALSSADGLTLTADGVAVGSFASHQRRRGQPFWVKLKKGEFTGLLIGQVLEGVYESDLADAEISVGKGWGQFRRGKKTSEF